MTPFVKYDAEHLDATRTRWKPHLVGSFVGVDGHPAGWKEIAILSCPRCGGQFGIGADEAKISQDGVTDVPVKCNHCGWSDHVQLLGYAEPHGREHYAKMKDQAHKDVHKARVDHLHLRIKEQMIQEMDEKARVEVAKLLPEGHPDAAAVFAKLKSQARLL